MPTLHTSNIKDAKLGSNQLSAVYKGSTLIWTASAGDLVLTRAYFKYMPSSGGCQRGQSAFHLRVLGTHTYDDPGRQYNIQYNLNNGLVWEGSESNWVDDLSTTPGVPFDVRGANYCTTTSTPEFDTTCRMRFRLSDGIVTDWSYYINARTGIPLEVLQDREALPESKLKNDK